MRILQTINVPTTHKKHFQTNIAFSYQKDVELTPRLAARHEETIKTQPLRIAFFQMVEPMRFELDSLACFLLRKNPLVSPLRGNLLRKLSSTTSRLCWTRSPVFCSAKIRSSRPCGVICSANYPPQPPDSRGLWSLRSFSPPVSTQKNATLTDCVFLNGGADEVRTHDL